MSCECGAKSCVPVASVQCCLPPSAWPLQPAPSSHLPPTGRPRLLFQSRGFQLSGYRLAVDGAWVCRSRYFGTLADPASDDAVGPWRKWMRMGAAPGMLLWYLRSAKVAGVEAVPVELRRVAEAQRPGLVEHAVDDQG